METVQLDPRYDVRARETRIRPWSDGISLLRSPRTRVRLLDTSAGNGPITQTGAAVVSGTTTITAGTGAVTLTNAGNDFASIGVSGGAVAVTDSNALALNAINASSLTVDTSAGNGNVTQNAAAIVSGATAVNAGSGAVTLNIAGNNFGSVGATGGAIVVGDINALALDATNASSLVVTAGGPISQVGAVMVSGATTVNAGASAITLSNAGNDFASISASGGAVSISDSNALALAAINATSLTLNTAAGNGNITQSAAAIVSGATSANAGSGAVTLNNAGNNFGSVAAVGGAVSVTDFNGLTLGAISATSLNVNTAAGSGAVAQSGPAVVSGASNVNAGGGAVTLDNAGNNFATLGVTGGAISIVDTNALVLSSLVSAPNQAVSVVAGGALTLPATAVDTGSAALTLTSGGTLTSVGTLRGTDVALTSTGAMTLANDLTALGTLALTTTNAPILQTGGSIVAVGTATVSAGSGDITLAQTTNDFQSSLLLSGGAISIRDINNLAVTSLVSGVNKPVSLIASNSSVRVSPHPASTMVGADYHSHLSHVGRPSATGKGAGHSRDFAVRVGACCVEIAKRRMAEPVSGSVPLEHPLDEELRLAVGIDRLLRMVLAYGHRPRIAISRARRREDENLNALGPHRFEERQFQLARRAEGQE